MSDTQTTSDTKTMSDIDHVGYTPCQLCLAMSIFDHVGDIHFTYIILKR
jgi:hypothetical protein